MPKLGDAVETVVVLEVCVAVGSVVVAGDPLLRVETDKVDADVPSPLAGKVLEIYVQQSSEVAVGQQIALLES